MGTITKTENVQSVLERRESGNVGNLLLLKVLTILYLLDIFEGCQDCQHSLSKGLSGNLPWDAKTPHGAGIGVRNLIATG